MAQTFKRLGASVPANTNNTTLYTVPADTTTIIKSIRICNNTATAATCRVFLVPSGGTADTTTCIFYDISIPGNDTKADDGSHILETGGTLQVRSGTSSSITFTASGMEIT